MAGRPRRFVFLFLQKYKNNRTCLENINEDDDDDDQNDDDDVVSEK